MEASRGSSDFWALPVPRPIDTDGAPRAPSTLYIWTWALLPLLGALIAMARGLATGDRHWAALGFVYALALSVIFLPVASLAWRYRRRCRWAIIHGQVGRGRVTECRVTGSRKSTYALTFEPADDDLHVYKLVLLGSAFSWVLDEFSVGREVPIVEGPGGASFVALNGRVMAAKKVARARVDAVRG